MGWGIIYNFQKKTRVEISQLASTPKYPNGSFNISIVYFESEAINPFNTHQTMFVQLFHSTMSAVQHLQYNICGTISAVQFLQYNICSTIILQSTPYLGDSVLTHEGVKTCIFSSTPVYARSCICYVSVKNCLAFAFFGRFIIRLTCLER